MVKVANKWEELQVEGRENLKGIKSAIVISNHVQMFDCIALKKAMKGHYTHFVAASFNNMTVAKPQSKKRMPSSTSALQPKKAEKKAATSPKGPLGTSSSSKGAGPATKAPVKAPASSPLLSSAMAAEKRLKANIHNPNYPSSNKQKDLESQMALVKKLKPAEVKKLTYDLDGLAKLKSLIK